MSDSYSFWPGIGHCHRTTHRHRDIHSQLKLKTAPTIEPVSVPLAKQFAIIEDTLDDELIGQLIQDARETVENWLTRALLTQTWTLYLDALPHEIELRKPPIQSVTSVKYLDLGGVQQTLDSSVYQTDLTGEPGRIRPAYLNFWPVYRPVPNCIEVEFVCGWTSTDLIPQRIKQAVLKLVALKYRNREVMTIGPNDAEQAIRNEVMSCSWGCYS